MNLLGRMDDIKTETEAILVASGVRWEPFCSGAMAELPQVKSGSDWKMPPEEVRVILDETFAVVRTAPARVSSLGSATQTPLDSSFAAAFFSGGEAPGPEGRPPIHLQHRPPRVRGRGRRAGCCPAAGRRVGGEVTAAGFAGQCPADDGSTASPMRQQNPEVMMRAAAETASCTWFVEQCWL